LGSCSFVGSGLLVAELEKSDPERNIQSIPDALWWAITTVTTVGYGDRFPVTAIGRAVGAVVMVIGIGLFGLLAASLASFMIEKDIEKELDPQMVQIDDRLSRIETLLGNLQPTASGKDLEETSESVRSQLPARGSGRRPD
jgi:voltage-gated potassium channel